MRINKNWLLTLMIGILLLLAACGGQDTSGKTTEADAGSNNEEVVIDVSLPLGAESQQGLGVLKFGEELEELSDGRFTIKPHYDNALGGEREVFEGMGVGTIDAGILSTGPIGGFVDELLLFDLPYIFENHDHAYAFLDSEHGEHLAELIYEEADVKVLAWMENGFRHETNSVRAIETLEDLEGIDHRTQESKVQIDTWTALGTNATPMAWTEVFTALQQGVIDSQENPLATIADVNFSEVQDYLNLTKHVYSPAPLMISRELFDSFSEEDQDIILEAAKNALPYQRDVSQQQEEDFTVELEEEGMTVTEPELDPFREAVEDVIEKWKPKIGEDIVDAALDMEY